MEFMGLINGLNINSSYNFCVNFVKLYRIFRDETQDRQTNTAYLMYVNFVLYVLQIINYNATELLITEGINGFMRSTLPFFQLN
jgi:hypothetical protein